MLNEPSVYACLGHALGIHAPGIADRSAFLAVTHHLNLAQGFALQALRSLDSSWQLGTTLNIHPGVPADRSEDSMVMAERHNDLWNRCFLGPLLSGNYPDRIASEFDPYIRPGDLDSIRQPISFLGINHYFRAYIQADANELLGFPENGAYFDDTLSEDGKVHDHQRIEFLDGYIRAMREAMDQGVDVRGYFVWSLLDNFEWASGYRPTFGLVKVDFKNQQRISKDSFYWYREFIRQHTPQMLSKP